MTLVPGAESGRVRARAQPSDHSTKYEPLLQAPVQCSTVHHSTVLYACRLFYDNKKKINFLCHLYDVFILLLVRILVTKDRVSCHGWSI